MCRVVILPVLFRPPVLGLGTSSDFSGVDRVSSTKSPPDPPRRPGVVGLYLRIPISVPYLSSACRGGEDVDPVAVGHRDDRALGVGTLADARPRPALLARPVQRVDRGDLDLEDGLDGDLDLGLVRVGGDEERVLVLVQQPVALLAHHRGEQDVAVVADLDVGHFTSPSASGSVRASGSLRSSTASASSASSAVLGSMRSVPVSSDSCATALAERPLAGPDTSAARAAEVKTTSSL